MVAAMVRGLVLTRTRSYEAVGYDSVMQFVLNLVNSITSAIGALAGVAIADRVPRRPILIFGTIVCAAMLAINAGLTLGKLYLVSLAYITPALTRVRCRVGQEGCQQPKPERGPWR